MIRLIPKQVIAFIGLFWCCASLSQTHTPSREGSLVPLRYNPTVSGNWYPYYNSDNPSRPGILAELILRLRQEHSHHLPRINQAIVDLKQQGTFARITQKYLSL